MASSYSSSASRRNRWPFTRRGLPEAWPSRADAPRQRRRVLRCRAHLGPPDELGNLETLSLWIISAVVEAVEEQLRRVRPVFDGELQQLADVLFRSRHDSV